MGFQKTFIFLLLYLCSTLSSSCARFKSLNAVEGKLHYDEHYSTFNNIDYESGESEEYGLSVSGKTLRQKDFSIKFDYSFYPDISYEKSKMNPSNKSLRSSATIIETTRLSTFISVRGSMYTPIGSLEISAGSGISYLEASGDLIETSKLEPTFRYQGTYTLFFLERLYGAAQFTFQESPASSYSEFYSISYNLGFLFR